MFNDDVEPDRKSQRKNRQKINKDKKGNRPEERRIKLPKKGREDKDYKRYLEDVYQ